MSAAYITMTHLQPGVTLPLLLLRQLLSQGRVGRHQAGHALLRLGHLGAHPYMT